MSANDWTVFWPGRRRDDYICFVITFLGTLYQFWLRLSTTIVWDIVLREPLLFPSLDVWILSEDWLFVNRNHVVTPAIQKSNYSGFSIGV